MKYLKIIGLAALAAMALAAFAASSASAATICSTSGTGPACKSGHGNQYTGEIHAVNSGNVLLTVTNAEGKVINTVTSTSSTVQGTVTNSEEGTGTMSSLTFAGLSSSLCSSVTAKTTASATEPWHVLVDTDGATENTNGIMTTTGYAGKEGSVVEGSFTCTFLGLPVTCKYSTSKAETTIDGSDTEPKVTANVTLTGAAGQNTSVCGVKAHWEGTYAVTTPKSLFIE